MAKITTKFRVGEYSTSENQFHIHFQLRPASKDELEFSLVYDEHSFRLTEDTMFYLSGLGIDTDLVTGEALAWLYMPRTKFGGWSWNEVLWRRVEVGMQADAIAAAAEKERRGKVAVERIIAEAPCLDWAMPALDELEAAITDNGKADVMWAHISFVGPATDDAIRAAADAFRQINDGRSTKIDSFDDVAIKGRISSMEAAGLGEEPVGVDINVVETPPMPSLSEFSRSVLTGIKSMAEVRADSCDPNLPVAAIDNAVSTIHTHFRRFLTPLTGMTVREHQFVRDVIREEIERVVGGVL